MPAIQPSIIFSKKTYTEIGGFRYDKFKICGDLDLFVRIARIKKSKFKYVPEKSVIFMKRGYSLGDLNTNLFLEELKINNMPTPNLFIRILSFIKVRLIPSNLSIIIILLIVLDIFKNKKYLCFFFGGV